jgi:bifunctional non-homologous end joining protein LigD
MHGASSTERYPRIIEEAAWIKSSAILDAEVVCLDGDRHAHFDTLHSRCGDHLAVAYAFDLLALDGDDPRRKPYGERKDALRKLLRRCRDGIQYVEHSEGHAPYRSAIRSDGDHAALPRHWPQRAQGQSPKLHFDLPI